MPCQGLRQTLSSVQPPPRCQFQFGLCKLGRNFPLMGKASHEAAAASEASSKGQPCGSSITGPPPIHTTDRHGTVMQGSGEVLTPSTALRLPFPSCSVASAASKGKIPAGSGCSVPSLWMSLGTRLCTSCCPTQTANVLCKDSTQLFASFWIAIKA